MEDWLVRAYVEADDGQLASYVGHHHVTPSEGMEKAHINVKEMGEPLGPLMAGASIVFITDSAGGP